MALSQDHPARERRREQNRAYYRQYSEKYKRRKKELLKKIFDVEQYSDEASVLNGCKRCRFWSECVSNLWKLEATAEGIHYEPLRCFAEHPEYDVKMWTKRA